MIRLKDSIYLPKYILLKFENTRMNVENRQLYDRIEELKDEIRNLKYDNYLLSKELLKVYGGKNG